MQSTKAIVQNIINLFYPLHCAVCGKGLEPLNEFHLCDFCIGTIRRNPKPNCASCGRALHLDRDLCPECTNMPPAFTRANSACLYEGALKELIHQFKYKRKVFISTVLLKLMTDFIEENGEIIKGIDCVTCVPLHWRRAREREFNQSQVLASRMARKLGLPFADLLVKVRTTRTQNELSRTDRFSNLAGAFKIRKGEFLRNDRILLIDDVMTTGTTLNECSKILLKNGAKEVRCFTLARGA